MDLRSIINDSSDSSASKQAAPVTPVQAHPSQGFREYSQSSQASPGKHPSQDYGVQPPGAPYATSPNTYQASYQGRPPAPPPIQAPPQSDLRSPARSFSGQSPYQHTPSSTSQYPFPQHQTQSPAQPHQYPASLQQRDSYPQVNAPPQLHHQNSYPRNSPPPQTPPIGLPGAPHPYLQHQRSQSSISNSTPTSAHSQHFNQYPQDSPVSGGQFPQSQINQHHRQPSLQSQPGTPLGPPLTQRSSTGTFPQPSSPYQQRGLSSGSFSQFHQSSPAPPAAASIPRLPSTPSAYDSQRTSLSEQHQRSLSERDRSVSVSPKTRLPSQPRGDTVTPKSENGYSVTNKRKMGDREPSIDEGRRMIQPEFQHINGDSRVPSNSPQQPPRKRVRYKEPPIWAQSVRAKGAYINTSRGLAQTNGNRSTGKVNGPSLIKHSTNGSGHPQATPSTLPLGGPVDPKVASVQAMLGPWEPSIKNCRPFEQITKQVGDWIFMNVINREDLGELNSRGVMIEIEAKLGQLIDDSTRSRLHFPILTECIVAAEARASFRSSMTEYQHQQLNGFLNHQVAETHPKNPTAASRVEIVYAHTRERDTFYEIPPQMLALLPVAVQRSDKNRAPKLRITYDKTGEIKAKIIKTRVGSLDIYNPNGYLDCRISINLEMDFVGDVADLIGNGQSIGRSPDRNKDRLSYTQGLYQLDLTQVTQTTTINNVERTEKEHELEVELSSKAVIEQGGRLKTGQPQEYLSLIEGFLDNVRVLQNHTPGPEKSK